MTLDDSNVVDITRFSNKIHIEFGAGGTRIVTLLNRTKCITFFSLSNDVEFIKFGDLLLAEISSFVVVCLWPLYFDDANMFSCKILDVIFQKIFSADADFMLIQNDIVCIRRILIDF